MHILTATDYAGIKTEAGSDGFGTITCPWCGSAAWYTARFMQCSNKRCSKQTANAFDILTKSEGSIKKAITAESRILRTKRPASYADYHHARQRLMSFWVKACQEEKSSKAEGYLDRWSKAGYGVNSCEFNCTILSHTQIRELVEMARESGAAYPERFNTGELPGNILAFCVQTAPYAIDRIVLWRPTQTFSFVWHPYFAGFTSLIGLDPEKPRLLMSDFASAMRVQSMLEDQNRKMEICSAHVNNWSGSPCPPLDVPASLLVAAVKSPERGDPRLCSVSDIPDMQTFLDYYPNLEGSIKSIPIDLVVKRKPAKPAPWHQWRSSFIDLLNDPDSIQMTQESAALFERTGTKPIDACYLIAKYRSEGRFSLADDVERVAANRVFWKDSRIVVRETAGLYQLIHAGGHSDITNFRLDIRENITFQTKGEAWCLADLTHGRNRSEVLFPHAYLQDRPIKLQETLQRKALGDTKNQDGLPTIIEQNHFRKFVVPHLRKQATTAATRVGADYLGWSPDRKAFHGPGFIVDIDGKHEGSSVLCPDVSVLSKFEKPEEWAQTSPKSIPENSKALISMIIASAVRQFKRCRVLPINIAQSSEAMMLVEVLSKACGQHQIHELNSNFREGFRLEGVTGYPIFTAGANHPHNNVNTPFFHLTNSGHHVDGCSRPEAERAGRALQYGLMRVVEWCLATGADDFSEVRSVSPTSALIREGRWLLENVCELQPWEVEPQQFDHLEKLLEQIALPDTSNRISLIRGQSLVFDLRGIDGLDVTALQQDIVSLGAESEFCEDKLTCPAVKVMPALACFYGQEPDVAVSMF